MSPLFALTLLWIASNIAILAFFRACSLLNRER